jgi:hypothetical protein
VNDDRRSFALLRPISDTAAQARIRDLVLEADDYTKRNLGNTWAAASVPHGRCRQATPEANLS